MDLYGLIEFCSSSLANQCQGVCYFILHSAVDLLRAILIFFTSKQCYILLEVVMRNNPPTFVR